MDLNTRNGTIDLHTMEEDTSSKVDTICPTDLYTKVYGTMFLISMATCCTIVTIICSIYQHRQRKNRHNLSTKQGLLWFIFSEYVFAVFTAVGMIINMLGYCGLIHPTYQVCKFVWWSKATLNMSSSCYLAFLFKQLKMTVTPKRPNSLNLQACHIHLIASIILTLSGLLMASYLVFIDSIHEQTSTNGSVLHMYYCAPDSRHNASWEISNFLISTCFPLAVTVGVILFSKPSPLSSINSTNQFTSSEDIVGDTDSSSIKLSSPSLIWMLSAVVVHALFQSTLATYEVYIFFKNNQSFITSNESKGTKYLLTLVPLVYCILLLPLTRIMSKAIDHLPFFSCSGKKFVGFKRQIPIHKKEQRNSTCLD